MLLEFRFRNFRSFRQEAVLSLVASTDTELQGTNTSDTNLKVIPRAVRSAVIYGPNASGKTNVLVALGFLRNLVAGSASLQPGQPLNFQPFRLDADAPAESTLFEVTLLLGGARYQYGFEFNASRITAEWLLVYTKQKPQRWFDRKFIEERDQFEFSSHLSGQKRLWQEATRPNSLFLSTAVQLNSDQLRPLYDWLTQSLIVFFEGGQIPESYSTAALQAPKNNEAITALIAAADIGIAGIRAVQEKALLQSVQFDLLTGKSEARSEPQDILVPKFRHTVGKVSAEFGLGDESHGTRKLFALAGPLLDILDKGHTLVIDELDRSLHPLLTQHIIQAFHDPELNRKGAQLIFSTHDTSLLSAHLLRRDQVWLTEKGPEQASSLIPLTTFSIRKGEALEKGYLSGRYGGLPILDQSLIRSRHRGAKQTSV
jgi:ABC-type polar amino acid transport system ATPase subunit